MGYRNLQSCVAELERTGQLFRVTDRLDPRLEIPAIQRRLYAAGAPAVLFTNVIGSRFPMLANLFGTLARCEYLFRDAIPFLERITTLAIDPTDVLKRPRFYLRAKGLRSLLMARFTRPQYVSTRCAPVFGSQTTLSQLPQQISWPQDGGAYLTLPQVYSEDPRYPGTLHSNLGMYRVQISGNEYTPDREAGLHYQLHRGLGVHHLAAIERGERLPIRVFLGGPPAMTVAAVMPLPEGTSELTFAGLLGHQRIRLSYPPRTTNPSDAQSLRTLPIVAEADFCLEGSIGPQELKPEGPFGDHLGYYSKRHPFPVLRVDRVWCRPDAIFPFTVVGRPPQEDTVFGDFIHRLTGPLVPRQIPGIVQVHAVDAAGVHPLLLAIGQERYVPFAQERRPRELLTLAHALLGSGQISLAKYVWLAAQEDDPQLNVRDIPAFFSHILKRIDLTRDLHWVTGTTIDTLDYTGDGLNRGSKLVLVAAGPERRKLATEIHSDELPTSHTNVRDIRCVLPGIAVLELPPYDPTTARTQVAQLCHAVPIVPDDRPRWMVLVLVDDASSASSLNDFLWTTFTRSDPAADVTGVGKLSEPEQTAARHPGYLGPLVIDARRKPHHAPSLREVPEITRRIEGYPWMAPFL